MAGTGRTFSASLINPRIKAAASQKAVLNHITTNP
jgi:hypothetical protein